MATNHGSHMAREQRRAKEQRSRSEQRRQRRQVDWDQLTAPLDPLELAEEQADLDREGRRNAWITALTPLVVVGLFLSAGMVLWGSSTDEPAVIWKVVGDAALWFTAPAAFGAMVNLVKLRDPDKARLAGFGTDGRRHALQLNGLALVLALPFAVVWLGRVLAEVGL